MSDAALIFLVVLVIAFAALWCKLYVDEHGSKGTPRNEREPLFPVKTPQSPQTKRGSGDDSFFDSVGVEDSRGLISDPSTRDGDPMGPMADD